MKLAGVGLEEGVLENWDDGRIGVESIDVGSFLGTEGANASV